MVKAKYPCMLGPWLNMGTEHICLVLSHNLRIGMTYSFHSILEENMGTGTKINFNIESKIIKRKYHLMVAHGMYRTITK